jgi:GNAT superfamily N-acetyltransferase
MGSMNPGELPLSAPEPLHDTHLLDAFDSGVPLLDDWLRRRAKPNQVSGASRAFVLCRNVSVVGYYALAAGAIASNEAPGRLRRNMPDPIPMLVLGRLAVDRREQGKGLGAFLLRDALIRSQRVAQDMGVVGVLVHAVSDEAKRFYLHWGFVEAPAHPMTLIIRIGDLAKS